LTFTVMTLSSSTPPAVDVPPFTMSLLSTDCTPSTDFATWTWWSACACESTKPLRSTSPLRVSTVVSAPLESLSATSAAFTLVVITESSSTVPALTGGGFDPASPAGPGRSHPASSATTIAAVTVRPPRSEREELGCAFIANLLWDGTIRLSKRRARPGIAAPAFRAGRQPRHRPPFSYR
jgi:hypothetical protein